MHRLIFILLLFAVSITHAQTDSTNDAWEVVERCIGEPTTPPDDWSFEGYIAYYNYDGIHAIRHELNTPYYLAFSNPYQFIHLAGFSADGKWLLVPAGYSQRANWFDRHYTINEIRIYSTGLDRQLVHRIQWEYINLFSSGLGIPTTNWIVNEDYFEYSWGHEYGVIEIKRFYFADERLITVNAEENPPEIPEIPSESIVLLGENEVGEVGVRYSYGIDNNQNINTHLVDHMTDYNYNQSLALVIDNNITQLITNPDTLTSPSVFLPSSNGELLAFMATNVANEDNTSSLYILDIQNQQIIDACLHNANIRWSPDSRQFLISKNYSDYESLTIVSMENWSVYALPYQFRGQILTWYP